MASALSAPRRPRSVSSHYAQGAGNSPSSAPLAGSTVPSHCYRLSQQRATAHVQHPSFASPSQHPLQSQSHSQSQPHAKPSPHAQPQSHSQPNSQSQSQPQSQPQSQSRLEDYALHRVIGSGGSATVIRASPVTNASQAVAIKALAKRGLSRRAQRYLVREIMVHKSVASHRHIVDLYDAFENRDGIYLVMQHLRGGDLFSLLRRERRPLPTHTALTILAQVVDALAHIHERGISHRDLKLENIMFASAVTRTPAGSGSPTSGWVNATIDCKLIDFGLACTRDPSASGADRLSRESCGTKNYCAPEVMRARDAPYLPEQADMWSVGVVLFAMLTRRLPFASSNRPGDTNDGRPPSPAPDNSFYTDQLRFDAPEFRRVPPAVIALLRDLLSLDPSKRPSAAVALKTVLAMLADSAAMEAADDVDDADAVAASSTVVGDGTLDVTPDRSGSPGRQARGVSNGAATTTGLDALSSAVSGGEKMKVEGAEECGGDQSGPQPLAWLRGLFDVIANRGGASGSASGSASNGSSGNGDNGSVGRSESTPEQEPDAGTESPVIPTTCPAKGTTSASSSVEDVNV